MSVTLFGLFGPFFFEEHQNSHAEESATLKASSNIEKSITLFEDIFVDLKNGYVGPVNSDKLFETAMSAMLKSLDPYTEYENLGESKAIQESVIGKYGGVGMIISGSKDLTKSNLEKLKIMPQDTDPATKEDSSNIRILSVADKGVTIVDAFEGYAYDSNIRVGDRILSIDGKDTTSLSVDEVRNLLRGEPGSEIAITVERDDYTPNILASTSATTNAKVQKTECFY